MNLFEVILLTMALSLSIFPTAVSSAVEQCLSLSKTIRIALLFAIYKGGFLALGYWICSAFNHLLWDSRFWISSGIFLILGVKMIFQSMKMSPDERAFRLNNRFILIFSGIAVNIDGLIAGLGFAFSDIHIWKTVLFCSVFTFVVTILGAIYGKKVGNLLTSSKIEITGGIIFAAYAVFIITEKLNGIFKY